MLRIDIHANWSKSFRFNLNLFHAIKIDTLALRADILSWGIDLKDETKY
jgi:hypothetical protein